MKIDISGYQLYITPHVIGRFERIYNSLDPRYTSKSHVHVATHVLSELKSIYSPPGLRYIFGS